MFPKIGLLIASLLMIGVTSICGPNDMTAFAEQVRKSDKDTPANQSAKADKKKTASAKDGYSHGDRLSDQRMSTRGLKPPAKDTAKDAKSADSNKPKAQDAPKPKPKPTPAAKGQKQKNQN